MIHTKEIFLQSVFNISLIIFWIASSLSAGKIFFSATKKMSVAIFAGVLGPIGLLGTIFLKTTFDGFKKKLKIAFWLLLRHLSATAILAAFFYGFFIFRKEDFGESLPNTLAFFACTSGGILGFLFSFITKRINFLFNLWLVFFACLETLFLGDWAEASFAFGTSSTYFSAVFAFWSLLFFLFLILGSSLGFLFFGEGRVNILFAYERFIGTRFLMSKKSSGVISIITVISTIAVVISCAGMIVVLSVMNGFTDSLRSKILGANAHLMIMKYGNDFSEYQQIIDKTKNIEEVAQASAFVLKEGMISSERNMSFSMMIGLDPQHLKEEYILQYINKESIDRLKEPQKIQRLGLSFDESEVIPGVILGKEMAYDLGVMLGDTVNLISPVGDIGPTGPMPKAKPFRVCGLFHSGMYEYDAKFAYILLKEAQDFFGLQGKVTGIEYRLFDVEKAKSVSKKLQEIIGGYPFYTRDWMQMNKSMFSALQLEKIAMLIILGTLIFMSSLLILVSLIMVVLEKGKDIAILKSMGASDVSIMKIFVVFGVYIGTIGAVLGGFLGYLAAKLIEKVGISIDNDIYYFSSIPVKVVPYEVLLIILAAILISFLATIPPALFAARLKPVEGLRYE